MKFLTRKTPNSHSMFAGMSHTANNASKDSNANLAQQSTSWSALQLLVFALCGAFVATFLPSYDSYSSKNPTVLFPSPAPHTNLGSSNVKILSLDPFIAHITDFVSESERKHLINLAKPLLRKSQVIIDGEIRDAEGRTSSTAFLPEEDSVVTSVIQRAADFQGYLSPKDIEVQVTSYQPGQEVKYHYDAYADGSRPTNRISTFFAILKSTCQDCGTQFPFINTTSRHQYDERWCEIIDCAKDVLTTKNIEGSALFWVNLDHTGKERKDMLHAGLPALNGEKVGLNVWTEPDLAELKSRGLFNSQSQHYLEAFPQAQRG